MLSGRVCGACLPVEGYEARGTTLTRTCDPWLHAYGGLGEAGMGMDMVADFGGMWEEL